MRNEKHRRGWIEIYENADGTWVVYDWTEHHDSGGAHGVYADRKDAVIAAAHLAVSLNRKCFIEVTT